MLGNLNRRNFLILAASGLQTINNRPQDNQQTATYNIEEKIREGYTSLASRTLDQYNNLKQYILFSDSINAAILGQMESDLKKVKSKGDILSIAESGGKNLNQVISILEKSIPEYLKPDSAEKCLSMAILSIENYFGIGDMLTMFKKAKLMQQDGKASIIFSPNESSLTSEITPNGQVKRTLYSIFNPKMPAYSMLANSFELFNALSPEKDHVDNIFRELVAIKGYKRLSDAVSNNKELTASLSETVKKSHSLRFFVFPKVIELAKKENVDLDRFSKFLESNIPKMDALTCYLEGDAYVHLKDVICKNSDLQRYESILQAYGLMALVDALQAPFSEPRRNIYRVGVGLSEHLRKNPSENSRLRNAEGFQRELSRTYFK